MIYYPQHHCFQLIKISFHLYPFILIHDRTPRMLLLSLTCLDRPTDVAITQTIFMFYFTSRSFPHLGRPLDASPGISPRYSSATSIWLTVFSHNRYDPMSKFEFFSKDPSQLEEAFTSLWRHFNICPLLNQFHLASISCSELSSLTSLGVWGDTEKFHSNLTHVLVSTRDEAASDRVYGLATVWVNLYHARISTVKKVVWQLTTLTSSGPDWSYALVQFNGDTCHVPLPKEGHLHVLTEGGTNSANCRQISLLEVHTLLHSHLQVVNPIGLNGCEAPTIVSPPRSLVRGANLLGGKPTYLKVIILQPTLEGQEPKAPPHRGHSLPIQVPSPIKAPPPKAEREVSMTMEVRELLSWAVLDTSGHASGNSTPKGLNPMVVLMPLPPKLGDISGPVDTSSHVSTPDDAEMGEASLEEIPAAPLPIAGTPGPHSGTPTKDADHLQKEANKALWELLAVMSSINAHQQKLVWKLGMDLHQNESKTSKSTKEAKAICDTAIKEAKATYAHSIQEAKTCFSMAIKEAKATCAHSIQEAETLCSTAIRDAEAWGSHPRQHSSKIAC